MTMRVFLAIAWAAAILALGPVMGILGARRIGTRMPPRMLVYAANAANLILLAAITAGIDLAGGAPALALFRTPLSPAWIGTWSVFLALVCLAVWLSLLMVRAWLKRPPKEAIIRVLPQTGPEKLVFALLCLLVALTEEFIYRGFCLGLLRGWLGSDLLAVGVVSLSFALMHGIQDRIAIGAAFVQGMLLSLPVLILGSLVPAVVAHAAVDVMAGFAMAPALRRMGMTIPAPDTSGPARPD